MQMSQFVASLAPATTAKMSGTCVRVNPENSLIVDYANQFTTFFSSV